MHIGELHEASPGDIVYINPASIRSRANGALAIPLYSEFVNPAAPAHSNYAKFLTRAIVAKRKLILLSPIDETRRFSTYDHADYLDVETLPAIQHQPIPSLQHKTLPDFYFNSIEISLFDKGYLPLLSTKKD